VGAYFSESNFVVGAYLRGINQRKGFN